MKIDRLYHCINCGIHNYPCSMNEQEKNTNIEANQFTHYVGITFNSSSRSYYFGSNISDLKIDDKVIVETVRGVELGIVSFEPVEIAGYKNGLPLKPVLRKATDVDIKLYENNLKDAKFAMEICKNEVANLKLDMNLISCE